MSQKPQHQLSACPGCAEPLDSGDRFCGACGYDLTAVPAPQPGSDRPTVAIGTPVDWPEAPPRDPYALSTSTQHPGDLPVMDSGGHDLPPRTPAHGTPGQEAPAVGEAGPAPARDLPTIPVRTDGPHAAATSGDGLAALAEAGPVPSPPPAPPSSPPPSTEGDFTLAAPDPRAAASQPVAPQPVAGPKVCVACRAGRVDADGYCENCGHAQPRERDHMEQELSTVAAVSDRGLRHHRNEDAFAVSATALPDGSPATLAIVCDGVSSATRPDEASAAAADAAGRSLLAALPRGTHPQQAMHEAIVAAAEAVNALAEQPGQDAMEHDPHRHQNAPACTIVGAIVADGLLIVGWIGDSRAYWVPDDRTAPPARLTEDDSWAAQMVAAGLMSEAEAYADERAHAITGWLGADAYELAPHTAAFKPDRSGVVVVCTDGLWNYAEAAEDMARVVPPDSAGRLLHGAQVLVGHALDGGGHDNVTVALLPFTAGPRGAGSA
ncbi:protein phosphatase 2C domain-containing protein [Streptomyces sp. NPDC093600]|uniref:PP2C family serine/threonine-protein phosphatase n=1 Tax=Streptomyces sp. NPDC093600 TaxID=3366047 RepID=UPI003816D88F